MAIDFRVRDFLYPLGILKLRSTFERTQWLPTEELQAFQARRLSRIISHAAQSVPYYRNLFSRSSLTPSDFKTVEDLKKLPVLSKEAIRENLGSFLAQNISRFHPRLTLTCGTMGEPLRFYLDKDANILEFVYYWRHWSWAGYRLGDRFAELGSTSFLARRNRHRKMSFWQPQLRRLMLNSACISPDQAKEMSRLIRKHRTKFLKGTASSVYCLALSLKEAGIKDLSFRAIFTTGEILTPHYRALIESVFNSPILDSYGHMERTVAVCQCPEGRYHINSDYGILELEELRPHSEGETFIGRAVGTSLYNRAMPLIRYDIGDYIEISSKPATCPCGRTLPLAKAIHGRVDDIISTPDGRFVTSLIAIPELLRGVRFIQFIQESWREISAHVVPSDEWNAKEEERLRYYLETMVGREMKIRVILISEKEIITEPSGKRRLVVSRIKPCPS